MSGDPIRAEPPPLRRSRHALVAALPVAVGTVLLAVATRSGMLLDSDSAGYVRVARVLQGDLSRLYAWEPRGDLADPSIHPPGYSLLLAMLSRSGGELDAARWIALASAVLALSSVALLVRRHCSLRTTVTVVVAVFVTRSILLRLGATVMSDLAALAFALAALVAFDHGRRIGGRRGVAAQVGGAALAGVSLVTRVDGLAVVLTLTIVAFIGSGPRRRRALLATSLFVVGLLPALPWLIAHLSRPATIGGRPNTGWFGLSVSELLDPARELGTNVLSGPVMRSFAGPAIALVITAGIVAAAVWSVALLRRSRGTAAGSADDTTRLLVLFGWLFAGGIVATRLFVDPFVALDLRHLAPSWVAALAVMAIRLGRTDAPAPVGRTGRVARRLALIGAVGSILCGSVITIRSVAHPTTSTFDLRTWYADSPTLAVVRRLPQDRVLYSNRTDLMLLLADHDARPVPIGRVPATGEVNPRYHAAMAAMARAVRLDRAVVVVFDVADTMWTDSLPDLLAASGLVVVDELPDGVVLGCRATCG